MSMQILHPKILFTPRQLFMYHIFRNQLCANDCATSGRNFFRLRETSRIDLPLELRTIMTTYWEKKPYLVDAVIGGLKICFFLAVALSNGCILHSHRRGSAFYAHSYYTA